MLTWEDNLEVHALRKRGWTITAIARHTGFDRKTVRKYLAGAQPGVRARPGPDPFEPFVTMSPPRLLAPLVPTTCRTARTCATSPAVPHCRRRWV